MNALEGSISAVLNLVLIRLQKNPVCEISKDLLYLFDEPAALVEDIMICLCRHKKIHFVKTRASYVFSYQPISFRRNTDQELA